MQSIPSRLLNPLGVLTSDLEMDALPKVEGVAVTTGSLDEKGSLKEKGGFSPDEFDVAVVGDVYEDVRAIDLGENGKERPIGAHHLATPCVQN